MGNIGPARQRYDVLSLPAFDLERERRDRQLLADTRADVDNPPAAEHEAFAPAASPPVPR